MDRSTHPAWGHAAQAAFMRYMANPMEFRSARGLLLPENKQAFPKLVLLDTLHWVALAKAHLGRSTSQSAESALRALQDSVQRGTAVVACTDTNMEEIGRREDEASRVESAEFLVSLSRNYSVASHLYVQAAEICNAVAGKPAVQEIRSKLVQWGFKHAVGSAGFLGGSARENEVVNLVLDYPELSVCSVTHLLERDAVRANRQQGETTIAQARAVRALDQNLADDERLDAELKESYGRRILPPLLEDLGLDVRSLDERLSTSQLRRDFWLAIPTIDTFLTLVLQRDRNIYAKTELNDVNDIGLLKVGIPYANLVTTDKAWASIVKQTRIASRYACFVTADLGDIASELQLQGCL